MAVTKQAFCNLVIAASAFSIINQLSIYVKNDKVAGLPHVAQNTGLVLLVLQNKKHLFYTNHI